MARSTSKVRLENGLRLDLNNLARRRFISPGAATGPVGISWTSSHWGEIERGTISADMTSQWQGWLKVQTNNADQHIVLRTQPRHFGWLQWYFVCPVTGRWASVLWRPPGATRFCSRQTFGRSVAYTSQCLGPVDRAWRGKSKIKLRLIGDLDPDDWELPPKPKWIRWRTYQGHVDRFDRYEQLLDREVCVAAARLMHSGFLI